MGTELYRNCEMLQLYLNTLLRLFPTFECGQFCTQTRAHAERPKRKKHNRRCLMLSKQTNKCEMTTLTFACFSAVCFRLLFVCRVIASQVVRVCLFVTRLPYVLVFAKRPVMATARNGQLRTLPLPTSSDGIRTPVC